ncbi:hypothetical protein U9M48_033189, partial [Paspalum notatum var. saurae]
MRLRPLFGRVTDRWTSPHHDGGGKRADGGGNHVVLAGRQNPRRGLAFPGYSGKNALLSAAAIGHEPCRRRIYSEPPPHLRRSAPTAGPGPRRLPPPRSALRSDADADPGLPAVHPPPPTPTADPRRGHAGDGGGGGDPDGLPAVHPPPPTPTADPRRLRCIYHRNGHRHAGDGGGGGAARRRRRGLHLLGDAPPPPLPPHHTPSRDLSACAIYGKESKGYKPPYKLQTSQMVTLSSEMEPPSGTYRMYMEEVRDSRISIRDSPAFLNLILDFTITSPSLSPEYKSVFLDLYVKTILSSKDRPPKAATEAFKPLFLEMGHEDFKNTVIPSCIEMLKRNPEIILQSIGYLLKTVRLDLSKYCMEFVPVARHSDEERRINALSIVGALSEKSSDPDTLPSMVNAIKAILGGSEGKLPQNWNDKCFRAALKISSKANRQTCSLSIEEVKMAILSALGSWVSVSAEAIQPDVVSFIAAGLKEKQTLRKGHLKLLRIISIKSDSLTKLSKTGFSKVTQRLDGIYALFALLRLAAVDTKADGAVLKEKLWALIAQNEPSLISLQLLPKLADDECIAALDLLQSLLVEHLVRVQEYFSIQPLLQMLIYLVCHPSWEVRKVAYDATKKVLASSSVIAEDTLFLFTNWLSVVGEKLSILKQGDVDSSSDSQLPFNPSTEVLVKCLFLIAPYAVAHSPRSYSQLILCSHHPCLLSPASPSGVYKRLQRRLRQQRMVFVDLITPNISVICKELLSQDRLFSSNKQVQSAALCSLLTLMTITPNDTFLEFEKHLKGLPERSLHDSFSENDVKIFYTPEGHLSIEEGVYIAEAVASKNIKLAKGLFRAYDDQDAWRPVYLDQLWAPPTLVVATGALKPGHPIGTHGWAPSRCGLSRDSCSPPSHVLPANSTTPILAPFYGASYLVGALRSWDQQSLTNSFTTMTLQQPQQHE